MIADAPVDGPRHRVADQPGLERGLLDLSRNAARGIERGLAAPVLDQFDAPEQATPAQVADMGVLAETVLKPRHQLVALHLHPVDQPAVENGRDDRMSRRRRDRVADIGVTVLEKARPVRNRVVDVRGAKHRPDRLIPRAKALGDAKYIGCDAVLFAGEKRTGPAHAAHDLIKDEEDAVFVADLANAAEVSRRGRERTRRRADYGFGHESHHRFRPKAQDLCLKRVGGTAAIGLGALVLGAVAVFVARLDMADIQQEWPELRAAPFVAAGRERPDGIAVIALLARDQAAALRFALFDPVLPRQLDRRFGRLGPAGDKVDPVQPARRMGDQQIGQRLGRFRGQKAGMSEGELVQLRLDRLGHRPVAMAKARHRSSTRPVEIALAGAVDQIATFAAHSDRRGGFRVPGEDMGHDRLLRFHWPATGLRMRGVAARASRSGARPPQSHTGSGARSRPASAAPSPPVGDDIPPCKAFRNRDRRRWSRSGGAGRPK